MKLESKKIKFSNNKNYSMHNEITLNSNFTDGNEFDENEIVDLISSNGKTSCMITYKSYDSDFVAYLSPRLKSLDDGFEFNVNKIPHKNLNKYYIAKVQFIKTNKIEISKNIIDSISDNKDLYGIILLNKLNGYKLKLSNNDIVIDENTKDRVKLSVKHRRLLDIELPTYINQTYLDKYNEELGLHYELEDKNVKYDDYYEASKWFKKSTEDNNIEVISVFPIYKDIKKNKKITFLVNKIKQLKQKILAFFIGQKELTLRVIRPYPIDETENCIRLSETALKLLGIEEMDTVIIRNGKHFCRARVLTIDDDVIITNENRLKLEQELSILVGIPSYMRGELSLSFINSNVKVERDLGYIFKKNLDNQITTIIGVVLSISIVDKIPNIIYRALVIIFLALFFLYLSFSEYRGRISN